MSQAQSVPVTAIVPTYNRADLLGQSLDSILSQSAPPAQVIIVDDGSQDGTADVAARYGHAVQYVRKPNGGKSSALNEGLRFADQPFIWIFDDDDIACPDALEHLHRALARAPDAGFSYGLVDKFTGEFPGPLTEPCTCYAARDRQSLYLKLLEDFFIWQPAMLVRAQCYARVGAFDERLARSQDYEMLLRLARHHRGVAVPRVLFHQRHHYGLRGPRHASVRAVEIEAAWRHYSQMLFRDVHAREPLAAYAGVDSERPLTARETVTALIQRASAMGRRSLWQHAAEDMTAAANAAERADVTTLNSQERCALRGVFEHGARARFASRAEARTFRTALSAFKPPLSGEIRGSLLHPVSHHLRLFATGEAAHAGGRQLARIIFALAGGGALRNTLAARRGDCGHFGVVPIRPVADGGHSRPAAKAGGLKAAAVRAAAASAPDALSRAMRLARAARHRKLDREPTAALVTRQFADRTGELPNLDAPEGLSERLNAKKLHPASALETRCADKIAVRDYVEGAIGPAYLTRLILKTRRIADISAHRITEERFVVKSNHDYGGVYLCRDRSAFDWVGVRAALADRFATNHWRTHREPAYRHIPRGILVEELLEADGPEGLREYKLFCFHGEPHLIMVVTDGPAGRTKTIFDTSFKRLPVRRRRAPTDPGDIPPPRHLREMLRISAALSAPFDFCRVDLYETKARPVFGELTFYPEGGLDVFDPPHYERALGELLDKAADDAPPNHRNAA